MESSSKWVFDGRYGSDTYTIAFLIKRSLELGGTFFKIHLTHRRMEKLIVFMKHYIFSTFECTQKKGKKSKKSCFATLTILCSRKKDFASLFFVLRTKEMKFVNKIRKEKMKGREKCSNSLNTWKSQSMRVEIWYRERELERTFCFHCKRSSTKIESLELKFSKQQQEKDNYKD